MIKPTIEQTQKHANNYTHRIFFGYRNFMKFLGSFDSEISSRTYEEFFRTEISTSQIEGWTVFTTDQTREFQPTNTAIMLRNHRKGRHLTWLTKKHINMRIHPASTITSKCGGKWWEYGSRRCYSIIDGSYKTEYQPTKEGGYDVIDRSFQELLGIPKPLKLGYIEFPVDCNSPPSKLALHKGIPNDRDGLLPQNYKTPWNSGLQFWFLPVYQRIAVNIRSCTPPNFTGSYSQR